MLVLLEERKSRGDNEIGVVASARRTHNAAFMYQGIQNILVCKDTRGKQKSFTSSSETCCGICSISSDGQLYARD